MAGRASGLDRANGVDLADGVARLAAGLDPAARAQWTRLAGLPLFGH
jgi:hypothetical protein